jgi:hypothetical protein
MQLVEELNTATMRLPFHTKDDETERHDGSTGAGAEDGAVSRSKISITTLGVAELLKKPGGYVNVMKLPMESAPPAVVVKLNVAATFVLSAIRSDSFITNEPTDTRPPIAPDAVPADGIKSELVDTTTPLLMPPFAPPIVRPESVTVTGVLATIVPLDTVTKIVVVVDGVAEATADTSLNAT